MVTTAMRARTNSRGDKSTLRGGAGKGGGGRLRMAGALSMMERTERSGVRLAVVFVSFLFSFFFFFSLCLFKQLVRSINVFLDGGVLSEF